MVAGLFALAAGWPAPAEEDDETGAGKGRLQDVAPVVRRLLPLTVEKGALRLDREAWSRPPEGKAAEDLKAEFEAALVKQGLPKEWAAKQADEMAGAPDAERIFNLLQVASRSHGSSRSHGGTERTMQFSGGGLAATLALSGESVRVDLREEKGAKRSVEVQDDGEGALQLRAGGGDGSFLLTLQQAKNGRFSVALVEGDAPFAAAAESYPAFYRAHREAVEKRLLPLLARLGVGAPPSAESPAVREAVLDRLRPVPEAEQEAVKQALADLDDAAQARREAATKALAALAHRHAAAIEAAAKAPAASPETQARLKRVLAEGLARRRAADLAEALGLMSDPVVLVRLLAEAKEADRPPVVAALEKATGQKLGGDVEAWTKWLETAKPAGAAPKGATESLTRPDSGGKP
jgi:hypothetical protein